MPLGFLPAESFMAQLAMVFLGLSLLRSPQPRLLRTVFDTQQMIKMHF